MDSETLSKRIDELVPKKNKIAFEPVKQMLDDACAALKEYEDKIADFQIQISELQANEKHTQLQLAYIKEAVVNAEVLSKQIETEARIEADRICSEANVEADMITSKAKADADEIMDNARRDAVSENTQLLSDTADFRIKLQQTKDELEKLQNKIKVFVDNQRNSEEE